MTAAPCIVCTIERPRIGLGDSDGLLALFAEAERLAVAIGDPREGDTWSPYLNYSLSSSSSSVDFFMV